MFQPRGSAVDDENNGLGEKKQQSGNRQPSSMHPLEVVDLRSPRRVSTNPIDEDIDAASDEEAGHPVVPDRPLEYLQVFSRQQIRELETQHSRNRHELDDLVRDNHWWYGVYLADNVFAIGTDLSSTSFQILTGRDGLQLGATLIKRDLWVSNTVALAVSAPLALLDTASKLASVSARQAAVKRTLDHALRDSYKEQFEELLERAHEEPLEAAGVVLRWGFNKTVIYTHSFLYSATNFLAYYEPVEFSLPFVGDVTVPAWLPQLPRGAQLGIAAGFVYGGHRYSTVFDTPDYQQNFEDFMWQGVVDLWNDNPDGSPWLVGELFRGNVSTPVQVMVRGCASTAFTRAYPRFCNIAETTFGKFIGLDQDTSAALAVSTTVLIGWHLFCAEYPKSYHRAMADHIKIEAILRRNLEASIGAAVDQIVNGQIDNLQLALSPTEIKKRKLQLRNQLMKSFIETDRRLYQAQVMEGQSDYFAFKADPTLKPQLVAQTLFGLYLGGSTLAPFLLRYVNAPISLTCLSLFLASGVLATTFYQDEKRRITDRLVRRRIDPEMKAEEAAAARENKPDNAKIGALIVARNVSRALSVLGSGKRTFGESNRSALAATVFFVAQNFMETLLLTYKKAQTAISSWSCCRRKKPSELTDTRGTLFDHGSPRARAEAQAVAPTPPASSGRSWLPKFIRGNAE